MNLQNATWLICGTVFPSFLFAWAMGYVVRRLAAKWGLVDQPGTRKVHLVPTPLGGGLAIWSGVVVTFALGQFALRHVGEWLLLAETQISSDSLASFVRQHLEGLRATSGQLWFVLGAATILMLLGLIDDYRHIPWQVRLGVQFIIASACVLLQPSWRLTAFIDLPMITSILSVLWIVGLINSFNMLDNMDGLSAGVAAIATGMLAMVLIIAPNPSGGGPQLFVSGFLLVLLGALAGFLWHNRPTARLFMGDAGSYFVGFCIAVATLLATFASDKSESPHAILAPLCVMAVPLYDTATVLWIRLREGRSPFNADKCHFSHRLVELGFTKVRAVATIYLTTATCGLAALLLHQVNGLGACLILLLVGCLLALVAILESTARRKVHDG